MFLLCGAVTVAMFVATVFLSPPKLAGAAAADPIRAPAE
jgi:hypothetical protein